MDISEGDSSVGDRLLEDAAPLAGEARELAPRPSSSDVVRQRRRVIAIAGVCALAVVLLWPRPASSPSLAGKDMLLAEEDKKDGPKMQDPPFLVPSNEECGLIEDSTDYDAKDLNYNMAQIPSADMCCGLCQADPECFAWTWGKERDHFGLTDMCFFKVLEPGEDAGRRHNPRVISGLAQRAIDRGMGFAASKTTTTGAGKGKGEGKGVGAKAANTSTTTRTTSAATGSTTTGAAAADETTSTTRTAEEEASTTTTATTTDTTTTETTTTTTEASSTTTTTATATSTSTTSPTADETTKSSASAHLRASKKTSSASAAAAALKADGDGKGGQVRNKNGDGLCLEAGEDGASLQVAECAEHKERQAFSFDGKSGQLKLSSNGTCLDVDRPGEKGTKATLAECNEDDWGQHWHYNGSTGHLQNRHGICLDVAPPYKAGSFIQLWLCENSSTTQHWTVKDQTTLDAAFDGEVKQRTTGLCLDSAEGAKKGANLRLIACSKRVVKGAWSYDGETGIITNKDSGLCLEAIAPGAADSAIRLTKCDDTAWSQQFAYDDVKGHIKNRHGLCAASGTEAEAPHNISMQPCKPDAAGQFWTLNRGQWSATAPLPPSGWAKPSFFCYSVMRTEGYEPSLIKLQLSKWVSIFLCEEHAVYSTGEPYYLGEGREGPISTFPIPKLEMSNTMGVLAPGQTTNSWLNTMTFMQVWEAVKSDGRYLNHDWTVKVDPDAVFLRLRLGWHLAPHTNGEALYVRNTNCFPDIEFFGAVESLSQQAVSAYLKDSKKCIDGLQWQGWGEDYYMQHCLDMLGVGHASDFMMLSDPHCHSKPCNDPDTVTFHPYKDAASFESCLNQVVPNR